MRTGRNVRVLLATLACGACVTTAAAQAPNAPYGRMAGTKVPFRALALEGGGVQLDVPQRDWQLASEFGNTIAVLIAKKGDATVLVQRVPLEVAISEADMTDVFESLQIEEMTKGQAGLAALAHAVTTGDGRRYLAASFARTGLAGREQVAVYVFNGGTNLYRLVCVAQTGQAAKYAPLFGHIAASFKVPPPTQ